MNTVNALTNFTGFQLHLGRSPRVIPPLVPSSLEDHLKDAATSALKVIEQLEIDVTKAQDNLLHAKIQQAHHAGASHGPEPNYKIGNLVMLSTANQRHEYKKKGELRMAKFFPWWDGPYTITDVHLEASTYTLNIPTDAYPIYHASKLKTHIANNPNLFPDQQLLQPGPIVTANSLEEYTMDEIIDSQRRGRGWQFLVRWSGYGPQHDLWLMAGKLADCEALDLWYKNGGDGPDAR